LNIAISRRLWVTAIQKHNFHTLEDTEYGGMKKRSMVMCRAITLADSVL